MNFRLIKNASTANNRRLLANDKILEWEYSPSKYEGIQQVKYYIYDIRSNENYEILPKIYKLDTFRYVDVSGNKQYVYITQYSVNDHKFNIIKYDYTNDKGNVLYSVKANIESYSYDMRKSIFVLNEYNILLQTEKLRRSIRDNYEGYFDFELELYNAKEDKLYQIVDENLISNGITDMLHINGKLAVMKLGYSLLDDERYYKLDKSEVSVESVNVVNVQQLISEILINQDSITTDNIEKAYYKQTIPYIQVKDDYIIYSKIDNEYSEETITFFHVDTRETFSCINKGITSKKMLANPLIINESPYIRVNKSKKTDFLNLKSKKIEVSVEKTRTVEEVIADVFIITEYKKNMFGKVKKYICIYKYPSMVSLHAEKGEFLECLYEDDTLYLFMK